MNMPRKEYATCGNCEYFVSGDCRLGEYRNAQADFVGCYRWVRRKKRKTKTRR